ncbi:MAG: GHKL domain-containing protein [Candidatus Omnitrophica bacterium]|nr:GHKL domain-containing protein [Candidatus Omnitrophota bacterium]
MKNKIILIFGIITLLFLVIIVGTHGIYHYRHNIQDQKDKAWILAKTIAKSIELPMLEGEMDTVQEILAMVGQLEHFKRIHLADSNGTICYSSVPKRIGTFTESQIIKEALAKKVPIDGFEHRDKDHIFSLALPVPNEPRCYSCHGKNKDILGVLRIGIDWIPVKMNLIKLFRREVMTAGIFYIFILLLSMLFQRLYNNAQHAYRDLQRTQEKLIQTEKMAAIGQMAAANSHDLRNPLTGIKMATYYLGSKIDKNNLEINNILKDIELEIDYASNVVTNILTFAKPTQLIYAPVDINGIIDETTHLISIQKKHVDIKLVKNYGSGMPQILIDVKQIKQVMINLITNALQAMPGGGQLTITTKLANEHLEIEVKDNGTGINKEDLDKIFTPFFTTKARGVGLGLSIVDSIIKKHAGSFEIKSEIGKGTIFIVKLPLKKENEERG